MGAGSVVGLGAISAPAVIAGLRTALARRLTMTNQRTGEDIDIIYWLDGEYIRESLTAINFFMRDWRSDALHEIDVRTLDILAAVHNMLETSEPVQLISGYRTLATNNMLRESSGSVAANSLHVFGMAADIRLKGRSTEQVAKAALRCKAGGVGVYRQSGFVHVDCGRLRQWGARV